MSRERRWTWWGELSGAAGDLGILLPLGSALAISGGFGVGRLIFLWGVVYIASGLWYRVPVSVQPLKAMAVLAIAQGIDATTLSNAAVGYGVLFCLLAVTGTVDRIRRFFSPGLVRGVQLGIGLVLARKAWMLATDSGWFLGTEGATGAFALLAAALTVLLLVVGQVFLRRNLTLPVLAAAIVAGVLFGPSIAPGGASVVQLQSPAPWQWGELFLLLMLPQLPLTLGNAVFAANDACHEYWPDRAGRVSARSLTATIGIGNLGIGLLGGFPMCHGAGGIAAHHRFGGNTGRTTILLGSALVLASLAPSVASLLLRIPVPVLAGLLLLVAWEMVRLVFRPAPRQELLVAVITGVTSVAVGHLAIGLAVGWVCHQVLRILRPSRTLKGDPDGNHPRCEHQPEEGHGEGVGASRAIARGTWH